MPYHVGKKGSSGCSGYPVISIDGKVMGCHKIREQAISQVQALYANEKDLTDKEVGKMWENSAFDTSFAKRDYSADARRRMSESGAAMPDGSYPIANRIDLMNAIRSWGRGGADPKVKEHIKRRARSLGAEDMIPENWK